MTAIFIEICFAHQISSKSHSYFLLRYGAITMSKWRPSAILDFQNLQFMSHDLRRHAILLHFAKICWNWTIRITCWVMSKNYFQDGGHPPFWIFKILIFGHVPVSGFTICCTTPNFNKIGRFFTEIWRFNDFENGGRLPSWIFEIGSFCHVAFAATPFCFLVQYFAEIGQ